MQKKNPASSRGQATELKRYFAKRVTDQVRHVIGIWRLVVDENWPTHRLEDLLESTKKLIRYAQHFQEESHLKLARAIALSLETIMDAGGEPDQMIIDELTNTIEQLSGTALRKNDSVPSSQQAITPKKSIYVAMTDAELAHKLQRQLEFFGFRTVITQTGDEFKEKLKTQEPAAIIMDVNLEQQFMYGIELINEYLESNAPDVETIFYSDQDADIHTLLMASRAKARYFHNKNIEMSKIVEEIEDITDVSPETPYRVLVVEDSKTQAFRIEQILNNSGMITKAILDPMLIMDALEDFQPEIILMDMYMPVCNGMELANVIRQQPRYVSIPIVFLSAEDDLEKQFDAMSKGGDDFLTKPIKANHLITAVRTKGQRARQLLALVNQDSLTGLLNHTSILRELQNEVNKARSKGTPLCFAMIDIDHFKNINDTYGHPVGDRVIKNLAMFLKQRLRKTDFIGRYGGEEFAVVLTNTALRDAYTIFDEIRKRFSQLKQSSDKKDFHVTFSCGVVEMDDVNYKNMTVVCDEILYDAKRGGRNRVCHRQEL